MSNKNIVQTPSHLSLFDKVPIQSKSIDYRNSLHNSCERTKLEKEYFSIDNINYLMNKINTKLNNKYIVNYDIVTLVMTNLYTSNNNIYILNDINNIMLTTGFENIKQILIGNNKYLEDKNNPYKLLNRPQLTSIKKEKQLPKWSI